MNRKGDSEGEEKEGEKRDLCIVSSSKLSQDGKG